METRQSPQGTSQIEQALAQTESLQARIDLMNELAWLLRIREPERALALSRECLERSQASPVYEHGLAASLVNLSFLEGEAGNLDTSLNHSLAALTYLQKQDQPPAETLIRAWYTLGWAYYYSSDYPAALEFGLKSLKLAREARLPEAEAWCLDLVASTYKDPAQAVAMYQTALVIFEQTGNIEGQSRILNNWAYTAGEVKQYPAALEMAKKSLQLAQVGGLRRDEINVSATLSEILTNMGEYEQAQANLHSAVTLFDAYGRDISSVYVLVDLGEVYLKQNDLAHAEAELLAALEASQRMEMRNEQARCHQYLSEIYEKNGDFSRALEHLKRLQTLRELIVGEGAQKQLTALRMSHQIETARRDSEIHRLQKEKLQAELDEHKRLHAVLEDLATRDPLTNLFNRRHFLNLAEQEWKRAARYSHPLCALMLDLDNFKQINDVHGHAIGDAALMTVANVLRFTLRATEIAGRYGGDEFMVLLPETLPQHGLLVANRIARSIAEELIQTEATTLTLTSSIGIACVTHETIAAVQSLDELLSRADKALYTAKRSGKGLVTSYA